MPELLVSPHPASSRRHLPLVERPNLDDQGPLSTLLGRLGVSTILSVLLWLLILTTAFILVPGLVVSASEESPKALVVVAELLFTFFLSHLLALGMLSRTSGRFRCRDGVLTASASSVICCVVAKSLGPSAPLWATAVALVLLVPSGSLGSMLGIFLGRARVADSRGLPGSTRGD
jgi:hypothetical protein